jgi:hypothetical protein
LEGRGRWAANKAENGRWKAEKKNWLVNPDPWAMKSCLLVGRFVLQSSKGEVGRSTRWQMDRKQRLSIINFLKYEISLS